MVLTNDNLADVTKLPVGRLKASGGEVEVRAEEVEECAKVCLERGVSTDFKSQAHIIQQGYVFIPGAVPCSVISHTND